MADNADISRVPPPRGQLLFYSMEQDELFGADHTQAYSDWGNSHVTLRNCCAEHVGTSRIHSWLPEECAWLNHELATKEGASYVD